MSSSSLVFRGQTACEIIFKFSWKLEVAPLLVCFLCVCMRDTERDEETNYMRILHLNILMLKLPDLYVVYVQ